MADLRRGGLELDFDLEGSTFVIGPTDGRPFDVWLPQAVELMKNVLGVGRRDREAERYLTEILARVGRPDIFPSCVFRWLDLRELPFRASFGMVAREEADSEDFLGAVDSGPVEPPTLEEVPAPPGHTVRRSISYSEIGGGLFAEVRYAVDTGHTEAVVWIHAGTRTPGELVDALDDLDALAASMRVTSVGDARPHLLPPPDDVAMDGPGMSRDRRDHVRSSVLPVVIVMIAVALSQFVLEALMPAGGDARDAYAAANPVTEIRLGGAVLLSLTSLLLLRGLRRDRSMARARDDRLAGSYLAAGVVCALVSAFTGAVPGVVVGAATVAAVAWLRRDAADVRGDAARDFRNAAYAAMASAVLYLGLRESYTTFAQWRFGYGASEEAIAEYAEDRLAGLVVPASSLPGAAVAVLVLVTLWRHRRRVHEARSVVALSGLGVLGVGAMSLHLPLAAAGGLVMLAALVPDRSPQRSTVD